MQKTKIVISKRRGVTLEQSERDAIRDGCRAVTEYLMSDIPAFVSVTVCGEEEIRQINRDQRQVDSVTDVLSFPMLSLEPGQAPDEVAEPEDYEEDRVYLGDMVICAPRAREQARQYGHSVRREFAFLAAHSVLHFLGYDHMEDSQRAEMEDLQKKALDAAGYSRDIQ